MFQEARDRSAEGRERGAREGLSSSLVDESQHDHHCRAVLKLCHVIRNGGNLR